MRFQEVPGIFLWEGQHGQDLVGSLQFCPLFMALLCYITSRHILGRKPRILLSLAKLMPRGGRGVVGAGPASQAVIQCDSRVEGSSLGYRTPVKFNNSKETTPHVQML